jgi:holo-[acyl-carrier protein] synthase
MQTKFAVGIDIIELDRVADVISRHGDRFLNRVYTPDEIAHCRGRISELAARFAAKEAVMKALGTGIRGVGWRDIEVLPNRRQATGVPPWPRRDGRSAPGCAAWRSASRIRRSTPSPPSSASELTDVEDTPRRGDSALRLISEKGSDEARHR